MISFKGALTNNFGKVWLQLWIVSASVGLVWLYARNRKKILEDRLGITNGK